MFIRISILIVLSWSGYYWYQQMHLTLKHFLISYFVINTRRATGKTFQNSPEQALVVCIVLTALRTKKQRIKWNAH